MASQPPKTSRSWGKNVAASIAHVTKDIVAEVMPNSVSSMSSIASSTKDVMNSLSRSSQTMTRQISVMDRSPSSRRTKGIFKRAMDDIKEGNLYYKDTANELGYLSESFEGMDIETPTDSEETFSAAYSATDSVKAITGLRSTMADTAGATISSIGRMSEMISSTQLKATEALSATVKNASITQSNIISEGLTQVAKQIQISNQYSAAMLEFMNKNISPTNQSMLDVMPLIGQKLDQIANSLSGRGSGIDRQYRGYQNPMDSIFGEGSGFNAGAMAKHIKNNFNNTGIGQWMGFIQMMTGIGAGGGIRNVAKTTARSAAPMMTKYLAKTIFGKDNLDRLSNLDQTVHDAVKEALYSLGDLKDPKIRAGSKTNRLINFFSDLLGVERPKLTKISLGGGRRDEAMQWNAIAQKTLVDVIPGFLSSIDKAVSGSQSAKHYDYRSGRFMTEEELGRRYGAEMRKMMDDTFSRATTKVLDSLAGTGIRFSEKEVDKIIEALNRQIDGRINGTAGNTKEYRSEMQAILESNGVATDRVANVLSTLEKGINNAIEQMTRFNHNVNMGNHDYQSYRNMMAGSSQWGNDFYEYNSSRSYRAINKGAYQLYSDNTAKMIPTEIAADLFKKFTSDHRLAPNAPKGGGKYLGGLADTATRALQNASINASTSADQRAAYQTRSAAKAADSAHAINKKKERFSRIGRRNLDNFKTGSLDSQVLAQNVAIEEAYLSGEPVDIMQGLAQDIHNNLLVPMYGTLFSKKGILNKFFGDDPNSEFNKLKEKLFGEEGLFKPMADWMKYKFTGKGYTAKDGTVYADTDDNVLNKLKGNYGRVFDNTMIYLLGEDYKDQEIYNNFLREFSVEGIEQRRAQKRARKEIIKRDAEKWAEERDSQRFADQMIGKGYRNRSSIGYGFSQYDPRWSRKSTGRFSDGRIATMATAGCGPVALANVANYLGYGGDPTVALEIAKQSGFLSNGGATEKLFTRGASRMGLNGKVVSFIDAMKSLKKGMPVVFAGKSRGKGSLYSSEGHIITAYRTMEGGVLVNDGDKDYLVPPEALLDGMTHAFSFSGKRGISIGGALDNDDSGRQFLRDRAKYSEETINMIDYLRAIGIDNIGYDELEKRLKKRTRKTSSGSATPKKHVYDDVLMDIRHCLERIDLSLDSMIKQYANNPEYLNNIKQILDKKIPDMNKLFAGLADTFNLGMENLKWALDGSAAAQRDSMTNIQEIIQNITSDKANLSDENVRAMIGSDIKDLTDALTSYMQAMPQQSSYLQQSDYAEAREIIGSLTSQLADVSKNIGDIQKPENLKAIIDTIATMNETQLKAAMTATLNPSKHGLINPAELFVNLEDEANAQAIYEQKRVAEYEAVFENIPTSSEEKKDSAEVKTKEAIEEHVEKIEENLGKQAQSAENATKAIEEAEEVMEDLTENPDTFRTKFSKGFDKFRKKMAKNSTSHVHSAVLGAGIGALNGLGGGLLTNLFLPGGPIGGAIMGLAGSIIGHSDTMNKILYGETDAEGHFHEGITTKKAVAELNAKFKKALPYAVGGATLGVVKNVVGSLFGLSLGGAPGFIGKALLGTGPMGAAIVGMSIGLLKNSDTIKEMLFGTKADDGKHYGGKLSGALNKMKDVVKASSGYLKTGFKGAGFGALSGMALSSMGYLPAALAVGGPIGMAVAGLAVGIASNTDRFKRYLFGTESVDKDGNYHNDKNGLLHRAGQAILQDAIYPMRDMMSEKLLDFAIWAKKNVELPFKIAFGPLVDKLKDLKKDITDVVKDTFEKVGKGVLGFFKGGVEKALTPVTWALRKGADLASSAILSEVKILGNLVMSPIKMIANRNMRKGAYKEYNKDYRGKIRDHAALKWKAEDEAGVWEGKRFAGIRRGWSHLKDAVGLGSFVDPEQEALAREVYGKGMKIPGQDNFGWFEANAQFNKANAKYKTEKERRQKFRQASELARQWSKEDKYNQNVQWTQELLNERYNQLKELGFDDRAIRSEAEIKNLMYHRGDWQGKWGKYGDEDLRVEEVKLQAEAAEKTENYQSTMTDYMSAILDIMMGAGHQKALDMTHGKRIERDRAQRDQIFKDAMKYGGNISDFRDEMTMTREEYQAAQKEYANDLKAMENMSYDERIQYTKDKGISRYVAEMFDDTVRHGSTDSKILDFESFSSKTDKASAEVKQSIAKEVITHMGDAELKSAAAKAMGIDLSDATKEEIATMSFMKQKLTKSDIRKTIGDLSSGVIERDSSVMIADGNNKGKIDVVKFLDVALKNGLLDESQASAVLNSFKRSKTVTEKTLNTHLKDILFEAMDEALDKNFDAYDAEQDREEEEKTEREKEAKESEEAKRLGENKAPSNHSDLYNWLFYNKNGEARGGIAGWVRKKVDKVGNSGFIKTMGAILSNPIGKIGIGLGAYLFSDQLIGLADVVSDVWQEHIPALWNFVAKTVVPSVIDKVGDIASWCVQALPGIFTGIANGLWTLVKDVGKKLGLGNRDITFGADEVNLSTGLSNSGETLVKYTDPITGETSYVMNDNGEYMSLNDYQYLTQDGQIQNISKGVGGAALQGLYRSFTSPKTAKAMLNVSGAAIRIPSAIGKHIPIVGNVFKVTDAAGKKLMNAGKSIGKAGGKGGLTDWMIQSTARYADNVADYNKYKTTSKFNAKKRKGHKAKVKNATTRLKSATNYADEAAQTTLKTVDKLFVKLSKSAKKVSKYIDPHTYGKWVSYIKDKAIGCLKKLKASEVAKLSAKFGSAAGKVLDDFVPFLNVAMTAYDAIKGWCDAEYLFDVPSGSEDGGMRTVSSVMNTLLGLSIGPLIDILLVFLSDAMGYDIKKDIAQKLYVFLMELTGQDDNLERWEENKEVLQAELAAYNAAHPTAELTTDEYQALKKEANSGWNKFKNVTGLFGGGVKEDFSKYEEAAKMSKAATNAYGITTTHNTIINQYMITDPNALEIATNVGNGKGAIGYGYSQADPRWAKYKLGKFANGAPATMDLAGCGPTALANVASQLNNSDVTPVQVAALAKRRGYLTNGGANTNLFDNGTEAFGLSSRRIGNSEIISHLRNGEKVIVSGKSTSVGYGKTPFTPAGHIITLEGMMGDNVIITDPQDGSSHIKSLSSLTPELTHAWAFSNKGKRHIMNLGNSFVGYGRSGGSRRMGGGSSGKSYDAETIANYLRNTEITADNYSTTLEVQPWYAEWLNDNYGFSGNVWYNTGTTDIIANHLKKGKEDLETNWFAMINGSDIELMRLWFEQLSPATLRSYLNNWATDASFRFDSIRHEGYEIPETMSDRWSVADMLMDLYFYPKYAFENGYNAGDISNILIMRGWAPESANYFYNNGKASPLSDLAGAISQRSAKLYTNISNGVDWNGSGSRGFNDLKTYYTMSISDFKNLSDQTKGGNPSVFDNWLYRYLYYAIERYENAYNRSGVPNVNGYITDALLKDPLVNEPALSAIISAETGVNISANDYTVNSNRPYGIVNGIPYYHQMDQRWASLKWKEEPFEVYGDEIASLAMILSAYAGGESGNRALTPLYMMENWFNADHPNWWNKSGFTSDFFSARGIQSLKETFDGSNSPLRIEKITSSDAALEAMKNNKLILMRGAIENGRYVSGGNHTLVGTFANDGAFVLTDPQVSGKGKEIILPNNMLEKIFKSGLVFSKGTGEGLAAISERDYAEPEQSSSIWSRILESTKDEFLAPIAQFSSGIISIFSNLAKSLFNGNQYESIFMNTYDSSISGQASDEDLDSYDYLADGVSFYDSDPSTITTSVDGGVTSSSFNSSGSKAGIPTNIPIYSSLYNTQKMYMGTLATTDPRFKAPSVPVNTKGAGGMPSNVPTYTKVYGTGGEYDFLDKVSGHLNAIFNKMLGINTDVDEDIASGVYTDASNVSYTGTRTASGLVTHARTMQKWGARYVWGGYCKIFTKSHRDELFKNYGDTKHNLAYYNEKYNKHAGKPVTDCSGLIEGYTGVNLSAHGLYQKCTASGPISKVPNAPGYLVFRKGGKGTMEHVGITTGNGNVIHCAKYEENKTSDVKEEKISKGSWTHWGKCHLIDYGTVGYGSLRSAAFDASVRNLDVIGYGSGNNALAYLTNTLGGKITQGVGYGVDPSTGSLVRHRGTDIAAKYGTPIHSPISGKVVESKSAGYGSAYGNYTVIKDNHGAKHLFAHMDRPTGFGIGSTVHSGDVIGNVGSSGYSTGPHLHYEVRNNDHIIDPMNHKSNLNIIESRFDESMKKNSSPTGGENDIINLASSLGATASNTDEIVNVLRRIADLLSVWQGTDEESKVAMLEALENSSSANASTLMNLVSNSAKGGSNVSVNSNHGSNDDVIASGGRELFNLIAKK